jgi:hypothetical protein
VEAGCSYLRALTFIVTFKKVPFPITYPILGFTQPDTGDRLPLGQGNASQVFGCARKRHYEGFCIRAVKSPGEVTVHGSGIICVNSYLEVG